MRKIVKAAVRSGTEDEKSASSMRTPASFHLKRLQRDDRFVKECSQRRTPQQRTVCSWSARDLLLELKKSNSHIRFLQVKSAAQRHLQWMSGLLFSITLSFQPGPALNKMQLRLMSEYRSLCWLCGLHRFSRTPPHTAPPPPAVSVCQAHWALSCWASACRSAGSWSTLGCSWRCDPASWVWGRDDAFHPCQCERWRQTGCPAACCYQVWLLASQRWA